MPAKKQTVRVARSATNILSQVRKDLKHVELDWHPQDYLDTGVEDLNRVLGHPQLGLPYGRPIEISGWECVAGDTLIDCPRNMTEYPQGIPIKDLVGKTPWVYSYDQKLERIVVRRASRVWKVGRRPVYKVTFSVSKNSIRKFTKQPEFILATANHPFMLRQRSKERSKYSPSYDWEAIGYRRLSDLKPGDRLMPLFRGKTNGHYGIHLNNGETQHEHRFILSEISGPRSYPEWDTHHKDENPSNNEPDNLEWKTHSEHKSDHLRKRTLEFRAGWQKTGVHPRGMVGKSQTEKQKKVNSKVHRERWAALEDLWVAENNITRERLLRLYVDQNLTLRQLGQEIHASPWKAKRALKRFEVPLRDPCWFQRHAGCNHTVKKVEFHGYEDVYDMTVPDVDNFVANGVVVHNSHGKTSLAWALAGIGQAQGAFVVLVDFENSYEESWTRKRGIDPDKNFMLFPIYEGIFPGEKDQRFIYGNELCTEVEKALPLIHKSYDRIILIMDSIPAILLPERGDDNIAVFKQNQALAAFLSRKFPVWTGKFRAHNVLPIFINQLRQNPMQMFGSPDYSPGGNTQKFHYHARVRVRRMKGGKIPQNGRVIGIQGKMTNIKNKSGGAEGSEVGYKIYFDGPTEFLKAEDLKKEN